MKKLTALFCALSVAFLFVGCNSLYSPEGDEYETQVIYAGSFLPSDIYAGSINAAFEGGPLYKFDTLSDFEKFKNDFGVNFDFNSVIQKYDDAFFEENTLFVTGISTYSGSFEYGVRDVYVENGCLYIDVEKLNDPQILTDDMAAWYITVAVPNTLLAECTKFATV